MFIILACKNNLKNRLAKTIKTKIFNASYTKTENKSKNKHITNIKPMFLYFLRSKILSVKID